MSHITRVNIQNYRAFDNYLVNLSPRTILIGPERSGKTTILSAIQAAGAQSTSLLGLKRDLNRETIISVARGDVVLTGRGKKTLKWQGQNLPLHVAVIPYGVAAAKCRAMTWGRFSRCMDQSAENWEPPYMDDLQRDEWSRLTADLPDRIAELQSRKRALTSEIKVMGELQDRSPPPKGAERLQEFRKRLKSLQKVCFEPDPEICEKKIALQKEVENHKAKLQLGRSVVKMLERTNSRCLVCASEFRDVEVRIKEVHEKIRERNKKLVETEEKLWQVTQQINAAREEFESDLQSRQQKLADKIREIELGIAKSQGAAPDPGKIHDLKNRRACLDRLSEEVTRYLDHQAKQIAEIAEAEVTQHLNLGREAEFVSEPTQCYWSLRGIPPQGLSGGDRAALILAMTIAWGSDLVILDDDQLAGVSIPGLQSMLQKLGEIEGRQVILALHPDRVESLDLAGFSTINVGE